jgi:protein YIPF1/2
MGMLDDQQKKMEEEEEKTGKNWFERQIPCLNVDYFKPHFNVTTEIVKQRIIAALDYRLHGRFFEIGTTHDFYGPFWIYTTLIFLLAGAGNLQARFISSEVTYDYSYITTAATIVYLFGSLYPLLIHYMLRTFGIENVTWEKIAYLYGYSAVIFLPLTLVCTIPSSLI